MIVRTAVLEGTVDPGDRAAFDHAMRTSVTAAIATYPGLVKVALREPVETEDGAPPVYMAFDLYFPSLEAMHAALASPVRQQVRARLAEAMTPFRGRVYHLVTREHEHPGAGT